MSDFRPYPRLEAFERLHISDGLTINAERWQQAHGYHRQRQNFQYQALHEAGIIYGLGVAIVPEQPDGRLLQIQPGVAIDIEGNPIIVRQPEEFRIMSEPPEGQILVVHLAVNYVDPDALRLNPSTRVLQESFRIVEKVQLDPRDVELCRIHLRSGATQLQTPTDVFAPSDNQLDFRGRCHPQPYPQLWVRVGQVTTDRASDLITQQGFTELLRSLTGLYPALRGTPPQNFSAKFLGRASVLDCELLAIAQDVLMALSTPALQSLSAYLTQGGVLLVVNDFSEIDLLDLLDIGKELQLGLTEAKRDPDLFRQTGTALKNEIESNQAAIAQRLQEIEQQLATIAPRLGISLSGSGDLGDDHPLVWQPFLFSQLPQVLGHAIHVKNWGGLVWMVGDLSQSWGRNPTLTLPREMLRSAQEWGINLLHFAAQRRQWIQAMQPLPIETSTPTDSLQRRTQPSG
ncbi:MAG: hypothetical protein KME16_26085 [Scytolyngbya sp. HA4215-MV1]|nr:hypothetical protein [Scytolyngbya sp. HA4215-MV1]